MCWSHTQNTSWVNDSSIMWCLRLYNGFHMKRCSFLVFPPFFPHCGQKHQISSWGNSSFVPTKSEVRKDILHKWLIAAWAYFCFGGGAWGYCETVVQSTLTLQEVTESFILLNGCTSSWPGHHLQRVTSPSFHVDQSCFYKKGRDYEQRVHFQITNWFHSVSRNFKQALEPAWLQK